MFPMGRVRLRTSLNLRFYSVGGPDLLSLGEVLVAEAGEQIVEIVAQGGDGLGVGALPTVCEVACGALGPAAVRGVS